MKLSVNTGFLVNRYPTAKQWCEVINKLSVRNVQITADLFNPFYPDHILKEEVKIINTLSEKYSFNILSSFTGAFTRVNHFCHPDEKVREFWLEWFERFAAYSSQIGSKKIGSHIGIISIPDNLNSRKVFQSRCIEYWKRLSSIVKKYGIEELTWEHMSIAREQGHVCEDIDFLLEKLKNSDIPIKLCLDPDHGDLTSLHSIDYEPYGLIRKYIQSSSQIHLKQTSLDKRKNGPFTKINNKNGLIKADRVLKNIKEFKKNNIENLELILELNAREREPDDSEIVENISESLKYWRDALNKNNINYE